MGVSVAGVALPVEPRDFRLDFSRVSVAGLI